MFGRIRGTFRSLGTVVAREALDSQVGRDPHIREYFGSKANWFFLFAALVLYAVAWPTFPLTHDAPSYTWPVLAGLATLPVAVTWSAPILGWAICLLSAQIVGLVVPVADEWYWTIQVTHLLAIFTLSFGALMRGPLAMTPAIWLGTTLVVWNAAPDDAEVGWAFGITSATVVIVLCRVLLASRRRAARSAAEAELAEAREAVLVERARIARDLHDVVAHRMSMVVVMAQTARYRITDVSDEAAAEFDEIAVAARASLDEVRQLLGVLRVDDAALSAPNPGLGDIEALVESTRKAGVHIVVDDTVDREKVGEATAVVVYRIVQESLANATRHAPGAPVSVRLSPASGDSGVEVPGLDVVVINGPARGEPTRIQGGGNGIRGMSERAQALGGRVVAGLRADGGFEVRVWVPATTASTAVPSTAFGR